jgi:hypothetical protein
MELKTQECGNLCELWQLNSVFLKDRIFGLSLCLNSKGLVRGAALRVDNKRGHVRTATSINERRWHEKGPRRLRDRITEMQLMMEG